MPGGGGRPGGGGIPPGGGGVIVDSPGPLLFPPKR